MWKYVSSRKLLTLGLELESNVWAGDFLSAEGIGMCLIINRASEEESRLWGVA